jgi:lipoprotein-anchoring transpeptidase ErfK/SrfK
MRIHMTRRSLMLGSVAFGLAGCQSIVPDVTMPVRPLANVPAGLLAMYGPLEDYGVSIESLDLSEVDLGVLRQVVDYTTDEAPGTIVVNTGERRLYLVLESGKALRYGIGVGKEGLAWSGRAVVGRRASWPRWRPTDSMIRRDPRNAEWAGGMEGGLRNPLGARALYLYRNGRDTLYRLHGTNEPWSIGEAVSSGCIRLFNHDIIDLHGRIADGASVVVLEGSTNA